MSRRTINIVRNGPIVIIKLGCGCSTGGVRTIALTKMEFQDLFTQAAQLASADGWTVYPPPGSRVEIPSVR